MPRGSPTLLGAAAAQAGESALVLAAAALAGADTVAGRADQLDSGVALTVLGVATGAALAVVAVGLARARRWSRTPALLTHFFVGVFGIYLLQAQRYEWGVPAVALAAVGFAAVLAPPSLRALNAGEWQRADKPPPAP